MDLSGNLSRSHLSTLAIFGSSCPPRGWSGAGVGVGMLSGAGDSLENIFSKFPSFEVSNEVNPRMLRIIIGFTRRINGLNAFLIWLIIGFHIFCKKLRDKHWEQRS